MGNTKWIVIHTGNKLEAAFPNYMLTTGLGLFSHRNVDTRWFTSHFPVHTYDRDYVPSLCAVSGSNR